MVSLLLDEIMRVLARYEGYRLVDDGPIPLEPRRFEAWTSNLHDRLAFLANPSSSESDLHDVLTSVEQHVRFGDFLNVDSALRQEIAAVTDTIRSGGFPSSLRAESVRQRVGEILVRIESRQEPFRSARAAMDDFLKDPSVRKANALESALIPLVDETELGRQLDDLSSDLAQYRPGGGEGLFDRADIVPRVEAARVRVLRAS